MAKQFQGNRSGYSRNGSGTGRKLAPSETFSRINPDTKFIENEDIEGIHLVMDFDLVRELQVRLGRFISNGTDDFFAAMWPVSLSTDNVHSLAMSSYVVAPKPTGPRFFLYIDPSGDIFLENMTQHFFRVDEDHAINIQSFDGRPITDTVLDGIFTREKLNGDSICEDNLKEEGGNPRKLTFVIQDAIRCNGKDLTQSNIVQRIAFVRGEIMKPRLYAVNNRKGCNENEAFDLDIADYQEAYQSENYLSRDFTERFKYPYRSLVFFPRKKGYTSGTNYEAFQWQENDIQECSFRLKIRKGVQDPKEAELHVGGPHRCEIKYGTITLTEEMKKLADGCIIDCRYFDHQWIFIKQRLDRNHPNGRRSVQDKLTALENAVSRERLLTNLEKSKGLD